MASVDRAVEVWRRANDLESVTPLADDALGDAVRRVTYDGASPLTMIRLDGWGHDWAGRYFTRKSDVPSLRRFDAAEVVWEFFSR